MKIHFLSVLIILCLFCTIESLSAEMTPIGDSELEDVTGQAGFSTFTLTENATSARMRIDLDIKIETILEIEQFKMGYYNYSGQTGNKIPWVFIVESGGTYCGNPEGWGWALDFEGMQMGQIQGDRFSNNNSQPFIMDGLIFRADYNIINGNKVLDTFAIGSDHVTGWMFADDMFSYSGMMNSKLADGSMASWLTMTTYAYRTYMINGGYWAVGDLAQNGVHFDDHGMYMVVDGAKGVGFYSGFRIDSF